MKKIYSVTVTYNPDLNVLKNQITSLLGQVDKIIVIDNFSTNLSELKVLLKTFDVEFLELSINTGLSHAQNMGIKLAQKQKVTHLLLLDQDSILESDFVKNMYDVYQEFKVGILGPVFFDPTTRYQYKATNYSGPFIRQDAVGEVTDATYVIASGSFFSIDVFDKVGPMNEDLFVDYIDVDWSLRAKKMGYKVAMTNRASMSHTIGDSRVSILGRHISVHTPFRRYFLVRNSFFMLRQSYVPLGYKVREITFNILRIVISLVTAEDKKSVFKMAFKGVVDGVKGNFGPLTK